MGIKQEVPDILLPDVGDQPNHDFVWSAINLHDQFGAQEASMGEAGSEPQSSAEPSGFCVRVLQQVFYNANPSAEPSWRRALEVRQSSGGGGEGEPGPSFGDELSFLPFLVPGVAGAPFPTSSRNPRLCPWASICFVANWTAAWIYCP